jgi:glutathione S-transferase
VSEPPRLLHFRVSHFNEKVRWVLDWKRIPHRRVRLTPGFHLMRVRRLTGQNKVPVLIADGQRLADSTKIIAALEQQQPEPPLYPADPEARARALAIEDHYDEQVAPDLRRIFWSYYLPSWGASTRLITSGAGLPAKVLVKTLFPLMRPVFRRNMGATKAGIAEARGRLAGHLDRLESEIGPSGYLVGDAFSVADLSAAAIMSAIVRPPQFPYPLPEPRPQAFVDLQGSLAERPAWRWVLDMYARHRGTSAELTA